MFALAALTAVAALNYVLFRFRWWEVLPRWFGLARLYLDRGRLAADRLSRLLAAPIVAVESTGAAAAQVVRDALKAEEG